MVASPQPHRPHPQPTPIRRDDRGRETPETRLEEAADLAERALLASVLCDPPAIALVKGIVQPTDFLRGSHAQVYRCMLGLLARKSPPDVVHVAHALALQGDPLLTPADLSGMVLDLLTLGFPPYAEHYAERVKECAERRRAQDAAREQYRRALSADFAPPAPEPRRRYVTDRPDN